MTTQFGFSLIMRGNAATPEAFVSVAECAETLDFDSLWTSDHTILPKLGPNTIAPHTNTNEYPLAWKQCYWETITTLSYLAAKTSYIQLGSSISVLPVHHPMELAKQFAAMDQLSGGRVILGVGVGWNAEEFAALNIPFNERGKRTDESLKLIKTLWTEELVSFQGKFFQVDQAYFHPKPLQTPHPPIWVGGNSDSALKRVAQFANVYHPIKLTPDQLQQRLDDLAPLLKAQGRSLNSIGIALKCPLVFQDTAPDSDQFPTEGRPKDIIPVLQEYIEMGVSHFVFDFKPETLQNALDTMHLFAGEVRPYLP